MIPTVEDLASDPLPVRYGDHVNPPALTNFLGCAQADTDLTAVRSVSFPPLFSADAVTARLFLDGQYFIGTGATITMTWRPDRIERTTTFEGLDLSCITVLPVGTTAVAQRLEIFNPSATDRELEVRLNLAGWVTQFVGTLAAAAPPAAANDATLDAARGAVVFVDEGTGAANVQGITPYPDALEEHSVTVRVVIPAGQRRAVDFVSAMGPSAAAALAVYDGVIGAITDAMTTAHDNWNAELRAVVTPGNDRYSGHLPVLETTDADLLRLYWMGILGVIYFKRETPHSVLGRTYDTLMPRYWPTVTFLWDYSLSSTVHALLDPAVMRRHQQHWMTTDIHTCMGTEWLTGAGLGAWYAVNDFAMIRMATDYLAWTGDLDWLSEEVTATPTQVIEELVGYARSWEQFGTPSGLADYGGIGNLLECVSSYVHEVASLNTANVYSLRAVADIVARCGNDEDAAMLRKEATDLLERIQELYVDGRGYWNARAPSGRLVPVRHCYDLATVLYAMAEDLPAQQREEMVDFFQRELRTPTWMRALSNHDPDAVFSVRPDHQWNGAYCAWPSEIATGLYGIGEGQRASEWLHGLARSANQGPFGQAHFVETAIEPHSGGARKVSGELPYINDWACSSGGSWVRLIIEGVFGVKAGLDEITATPDLTGFDPAARLVGLNWQGRSYTVDRDGISGAA